MLHANRHLRASFQVEKFYVNHFQNDDDGEYIKENGLWSVQMAFLVTDS